MSTLENTVLEESAFEQFCIAQEDNSEFAEMLYECYYDSVEQYLESENCEFDPVVTERIFSILLKLDYRACCLDPIECAYYYRDKH